MSVFTLDQFVEFSKSKGSHFFDKGSMRFFKSRLLRSTFKRLDDKVYFVTSEQPPSSHRLYTIRVGSLETGSVETLNGEFGKFFGASSAKVQLERIIKGVN